MEDDPSESGISMDKVEVMNIQDDEEVVVTSESDDNDDDDSLDELVNEQLESHVSRMIVDDDEEEEDDDEELPPILELPSTGYLHDVDENLPPPVLQPANQIGDPATGQKKEEGKTGGEDDDEIKVVESDGEGTSTTDSDDELVQVDYLKKPPKKFRKLLRKYRFISKKESWMYAVRNFYEQQPSNIRRLLKTHKDAKGNPVEESIGVLFEKIYAERERIIRARNIKLEEEEPLPRTTVVSVKIACSDSRLTHVAYPANVVNDDKAIATLGGLGAISKTFDQPNKKLTLKFRPTDPFANGVSATGRSACGLLLRVRHRKNPNPATEPGAAKPINTTKNANKINLDALGDDPVKLEDIQDLLLDNQFMFQATGGGHTATSEQSVQLNGKNLSRQDVIQADKRLTTIRNKRLNTKKAWGTDDTKEYNLKVPEDLDPVEDSATEVQAVGIVHRFYEFNGICDFQYLPAVKKSDGTIVSVKDRIFPILGGSDNPEKLVCKDLVNDETNCLTFILPPAMTRLDNTPKGLMDELITLDKSDQSTRRAPPDDSIFSSRLKRIIYTISYNFQVENPTPEDLTVPTQPLKLALKDIERRQIKKELIDNVRSKFEERPIWSKAALGFATKIPALTLKYIIPYFAYFAANGPWRNTWIKFGVDPRKIPQTVLYQSVDFRVPFIYRRFMDVAPRHQEAIHKFLPEYFPPKTQMFYQLCDIRLDEIKQLVETLNKRAESGTLVYDEKHGFIKEGTYEYFRYILTYYLENLLQEYGKLPETTRSDVTFKIPPGEIEPTSKLKAAPHRRLKVKRIRKSTKKFVDIHATKTTGKKAASKKKQGGKATKRPYKDSLEDLALNDLRDDSDNEGMDLFEGDDEYI